jgi:hypothetical protein
LFFKLYWRSFATENSPILANFGLFDIISFYGESSLSKSFLVIFECSLIAVRNAYDEFPTMLDFGLYLGDIGVLSFLDETAAVVLPS